MGPITWTVDRVRLSDLQPWGHNPRHTSKRQAKRLLRSWQDFGQVHAIAVGPNNEVYDGHQRLSALLTVYGDDYEVDVRRASRELSDVERRALVLALHAGAVGSWDWDELTAWDPAELQEWGLDEEYLANINRDQAALIEMLEMDDGADEEPGPAPEAQIDRAEELREKWGVELGQLWRIPSRSVPGGEHRIICGDCTDAETVARVMQGEKAVLVHADPPYGMGKEKDGVINDNLYREKLDAFQMQWWRAARPYLADNGSAYIWGNAEDLWRLWYCGGLKDSERLTFRNEIVWDKQFGLGIGSDAHRMYPTVTERCLFFMLGEQGYNDNADNYWEGWEPIRRYLEGEARRVGLNNKKLKEICGVGSMYSHWFTKSQWLFITRENYEKLQKAYRGDAFKREYDELKREYDELKREYDELKREFYATRAYFDNTHDNMTDVWSFPRVAGDERYGHATPKPIEAMERAIKSSCPPNGIVYVPFLGTAPELVACERLGRLGRGVEISPGYVAVALQRLADMGLTPEAVEHGAT